MNLAALCIYLTAANMIDAQTLQVGKLVAFMEYLFHAMFSVMLFCMVLCCIREPASLQSELWPY